MWKSLVDRVDNGLNLTWWRRRNWITPGEWITRVTIDTCANWTVIVDPTIGICSTCSRTWILAFLTNTRFVVGTFGINNTLRSTSWRCANIFRQTWTHCLSIHFTTLTIWSAWWRLTWIYIIRHNNGYKLIKSDINVNGNENYWS